MVPDLHLMFEVHDISPHRAYGLLEDGHGVVVLSLMVTRTCVRGRHGAQCYEPQHTNINNQGSHQYMSPAVAVVLAHVSRGALCMMLLLLYAIAHITEWDVVSVGVVVPCGTLSFVGC